MTTRMKRCSLDAFGSIIPIMSMPHMEKGHGEERTLSKSRRHMDLISVELALVTSFDVFAAIGFHRYPIVSCSQDFSRHCMPIGMGSKGPFMHFMDDCVCFLPVDASEQNHVEVSFVQNIFIEEEVS